MTDTLVEPEKTKPSLLELAAFFSGITCIAFGGGAAWVQRLAVHDRKWFTLEEYADLLSLCQAMPGAVFCNLAVGIGMREYGIRGAAVTLGSILLPGIIIATLVVSLHVQLTQNLNTRHVLHGITAAAAGLFAATAVQTGRHMVTRFHLVGACTAVIACAEVLIAHWSIPLVLLTTVPIGILAQWRKQRVRNEAAVIERAEP